MVVTVPIAMTSDASSKVSSPARQSRQSNLIAKPKVMLALPTSSASNLRNIRLYQHSGFQVQSSVAATGNPCIVGNQCQGGTELLIQIKQQIDDVGTGLGIQISGRLICK